MSGNVNKTRIAPTPSGFLHLGNVYSFMITVALAKRSNASVLLRIDDMDRDRVEEKFITDIFDTLSFFNISWQEGPKDVEEFYSRFSQRHRMDIYTAAEEKLRERQHVFACECSRAQVLHDNPDGNYPGTCLHKDLPLDRPGVSWRLKTNDDPMEMKTPDGVVKMSLPAKQRYFVVRRNNGLPAYQLTSLMDDIYFNVNLIVRGEDLLDSTLAQLQLARYVDENKFADAVFYHHPLLKDPEGRKLSKSSGSTSIQYLRRHGSTAGDILNRIGIG